MCLTQIASYALIFEAKIHGALQKLRKSRPFNQNVSTLSEKPRKKSEAGDLKLCATQTASVPEHAQRTHTSEHKLKVALILRGSPLKIKETIIEKILDLNEDRVIGEF